MSDIKEKLKLIREGVSLEESVVETDFITEDIANYDLYESVLDLMTESAEEEILTEASVNIFDRMSVGLFRLLVNMEKLAEQDLTEFKVLQDKLKDKKAIAMYNIGGGDDAIKKVRINMLSHMSKTTSPDAIIKKFSKPNLTQAQITTIANEIKEDLSSEVAQAKSLNKGYFDLANSTDSNGYLTIEKKTYDAKVNDLYKMVKNNVDIIKSTVATLKKAKLEKPDILNKVNSLQLQGGNKVASKLVSTSIKNQFYYANILLRMCKYVHSVNTGIIRQVKKATK